MPHPCPSAASDVQIGIEGLALARIVHDIWCLERIGSVLGCARASFTVTMAAERRNSRRPCSRMPPAGRWKDSKKEGSRNGRNVPGARAVAFALEGLRRTRDKVAA